MCGGINTLIDRTERTAEPIWGTKRPIKRERNMEVKMSISKCKINKRPLVTQPMERAGISCCILIGQGQSSIGAQQQQQQRSISIKGQSSIGVQQQQQQLQLQISDSSSSSFYYYYILEDLTKHSIDLVHIKFVGYACNPKSPTFAMSAAFCLINYSLFKIHFLKLLINHSGTVGRATRYSLNGQGSNLSRGKRLYFLHNRHDQLCRLQSRRGTLSWR